MKDVRETTKRRNLMQALKTSKNLREASKKAGFSLNSRWIYSNSTKRYIAQFMEQGDLTVRDIERLHKHLIALSLENRDLTNASRNTENIGRMKTAYTDKTEHSGSIEYTEAQKREYNSYRGLLGLN